MYHSSSGMPATTVLNRFLCRLYGESTQISLDPTFRGGCGLRGSVEASACTELRRKSYTNFVALASARFSNERWNGLNSALPNLRSKTIIVGNLGLPCTPPSISPLPMPAPSASLFS